MIMGMQSASTQRVGVSRIVALIVCCLAGAIACTTMNTTLRYRLTVVVDTPQGVRTGSSVVEVKGYLSRAFPGPEAGGPRLHSRGEATPVKLTDGRYVFVVFASGASTRRTFTMLTAPFADQLPPKSSDRSANGKSMMEQFRALAEAKGVRQVNPQDYPVIATFTDLTNPYSIRIAPASEISTILPGHRVLRMTVEITDDPVSNSIRQILPWILCKDIGFLNKDVNRYWPRPFPEFQKIGIGAFIQGANVEQNKCNLKRGKI